MDYFTLLNLKREPFSNSPDPDNFYPSSQHVNCMQKLELAVRMRRGLNIVTGRVGTGKTTLCRQLIRKLSGSDEISLYLILDPSFSTVGEMLSSVVRLLTGQEADPGATEWQMKETIKSFLFRMAAEEEKVVVLIVDEGQKLADSSLETLREFLNYETNEQKLLQIIIFAQNEFDEILQTHQNFNDRVNTRISIGGLSFNETRRLINHRLVRAAGKNRPEVSFSLAACWQIYRLSGGYPRKIINLCHQSLLAMIIRNKKKVSTGMVLAGATSLSYGFRWTLARPLFPVLLLAVSLLLTPLYKWENIVEERSSVISSSVVTVQQSRIAEKKPSAAPVSLTVSDTRAEITPPAHLGTIRVRPSDTLASLILLVYGPYSFNGRNLNAVLKENPHLTDPNHIEIGEEITFPYLYNPSRTLAAANWFVELSQPSTFQEAVDLLSRARRAGIAARLFYDWSLEKGKIWIVVHEKPFDAKAEAEQAQAALPNELAAGSRVIAGLQSSYWSGERAAAGRVSP